MSIFRRGKHAAEEPKSDALDLGQASIDRIAKEIATSVAPAYSYDIQNPVEPEPTPEELAALASEGYDPDADVGDEAPEPTSEAPNYYSYPGGLQMIDITRHHTGNAAQAIQYIGRATRLDGVTKGDSPEALEEDLDKAINFLNDEKFRIRGGQ